MEYDPPFLKVYETLFNKTIETNESHLPNDEFVVVEELQLPLIDLGRLQLGEKEREECKMEIAKASTEWGFFQVVNHGISRQVLEKMRSEQVKLFRQPFDKKREENKHFNLSAGCYRWGTPTATCLKQLQWSEAFHIPMTDISALSGFDSLRSTIEEFAAKVSELAKGLVEILAEKMGHNMNFFEEHCSLSSCYLRMNRYLACPVSSQVCGIMPHTDTDFLTILHQDQVGGLQLVKDGKWIAVKPNPQTLVINIGDLFQAWSNDVYRSVPHRVIANSEAERFSIAYLFCPSYDAAIQSCHEPSVYRKFTFKEYKEQVQEDVRNLGFKVGLSRFLL